MSLRAKIHKPSEPLVFYEIVPPSVDDSSEMEDRLKLVGDVAGLVDVINIPEIRDELARGPRRGNFRQRIEPRVFAKAIHDRHSLETSVNRVTVHDSLDDQRRWLKESAEVYGVRDLILVGGESVQFTYPGPSVSETAKLANAEKLDLLLGGITIPSRPREAERVLSKHKSGIEFFTTQVLLDAAPTVSLLRALDGVKAHLILSFTPVSHPRDLTFLKWLGVGVPESLAISVDQAPERESAAAASIELAKRILQEVFSHLTPLSPAIGIQVERITKRNSAAALQMLIELADFYPKLLRQTMSAMPVDTTQPK